MWLWIPIEKEELIDIISMKNNKFEKPKKRIKAQQLLYALDYEKLF